MTRSKAATEQRSSCSDNTKTNKDNKHNNKTKKVTGTKINKTYNSEGNKSNNMEKDKMVSYKSYANDEGKIGELDPNKPMEGKKGTINHEKIKEAPQITLGQPTQESDEEDAGTVSTGNEENSIIEINSDDESYNTPYTSPNNTMKTSQM